MDPCMLGTGQPGPEAVTSEAQTGRVTSEPTEASVALAVQPGGVSSSLCGASARAVARPGGQTAGSCRLSRVRTRTQGAGGQLPVGVEGQGGWGGMGLSLQAASRTWQGDPRPKHGVAASQAFGSDTGDRKVGRRRGRGAGLSSGSPGPLCALGPAEPPMAPSYLHGLRLCELRSPLLDDVSGEPPLGLWLLLGAEVVPHSLHEGPEPIAFPQGAPPRCRRREAGSVNWLKPLWAGPAPGVSVAPGC